MATILLGVAVFGICVFLLSVGLIFSKKTRLKKSCGGGGTGEHLVGPDGKPLPCDTCSCQSRGPSDRCEVVFGSDGDNDEDNDEDNV